MQSNLLFIYIFLLNSKRLIKTLCDFFKNGFQKIIIYTSSLFQPEHELECALFT